MRMPLIDGQGNFGSIDGDGAAAMRYTEARLTALGESMLEDIEKDTVDWRPNFDGSLNEPTVLPARFPNLLVNGVSGIAVACRPTSSAQPGRGSARCGSPGGRMGAATRFKVAKLMKFIPGPDLPTGGLLYRYRQRRRKENRYDRRAYFDRNSTLVARPGGYSGIGGQI